MPILLPAIPYLPEPPFQMDAGALSAHGQARDAEFYLTALTYGHYLWKRALIARAILKLDRAFGADLKSGELILQQWPLPYEAMAWILTHSPPGALTGNPRVHFQHLADRMNEPRREQRRWRMWGCWALCRSILPELPPDPLHIFQEPSFALIEQKLAAHGIFGEVEVWKSAMRHANQRSGQ